MKFEHLVQLLLYEYVYTKAFGSDELILKAFDERLDETINGTLQT